MWWDVLKNAELDSKSKDTLDTSRIKINTDDNNCKKKLRYYYNNPKVEKQRLQLKRGNMKFDITGMSEDTACKIVNWIEALPIFPIRNEMLDFFETKIDGYFIEIMLEKGWVLEGLKPKKHPWYLSLEISYSGKWIIDLFLSQQEGEKPESIDWRK
tara:strand:+ start:93 stop:560 length:468 start_codon:yes stop_codon:yes gene_type:complete